MVHKPGGDEPASWEVDTTQSKWQTPNQKKQLTFNEDATLTPQKPMEKMKVLSPK